MISECNTQLGRQIFGTEEGVLPLLQACDWPFNFIQFRQLVRDAVDEDGIQAGVGEDDLLLGGRSRVAVKVGG